MQLSQEQKLILTAIQFQANCSAAQFRRTCPRLKGMSTEKIRRTIQRLSAHGLLTLRPHTNPARVGQVETLLLCTIEQSLRNLPEFAAHALELPMVREVLRLAGSHDLLIVLQSKSVLDTATFLAELSGAGWLIRAKEVAVTYEHSLFSRNYLDGNTQRAMLRVDHAQDEVELHPTEKQITEHLLPSDGLGSHDFAATIGVGRGALQYRLQTLKEKKVYLGSTYELEAWKLGIECFEFLLSLARPTPAVRKQLLSFCQAELNITECRLLVGAFDCQISAEFENRQQYLQFKQNLSVRFRGELTDLLVLSRRDRSFRRLSQKLRRPLRHAA